MKVPLSFRVEDETRALLRKLADKLKRSQTQTIEVAIESLARKHEVKLSRADKARLMLE